MLKCEIDSFIREWQVTKIGIGIPGTLNKKRTTIIESPNIPELNGLDIHKMLYDYFSNIDFYIENDANAAALGELYFGKNDIPDSFLFITLGTGLGSALIIDRKIFKGVDGNGMELGHIIVSNGRTVEENVGKKNIVAMVKKCMTPDQYEEFIDKYGDIDSKKIIKAANKGNEICLWCFEEVGVFLADALINAVRILDVKTIVIGGGMSKIFIDYIYQSMYKKMKKILPPYYTENLDVRKASLNNDAGIIGVASLCFKEDYTS